MFDDTKEIKSIDENANVDYESGLLEQSAYGFDESGEELVVNKIKEAVDKSMPSEEEDMFDDTKEIKSVDENANVDYESRLLEQSEDRFDETGEELVVNKIKEAVDKSMPSEEEDVFDDTNEIKSIDENANVDNGSRLLEQSTDGIDESGKKLAVNEVNKVKEAVGKSMPPEEEDMFDDTKELKSVDENANVDNESRLSEQSTDGFDKRDKELEVNKVKEADSNESVPEEIEEAMPSMEEDLLGFSDHEGYEDNNAPQKRKNTRQVMTSFSTPKKALAMSPASILSSPSMAKAPVSQISSPSNMNPRKRLLDRYHGQETQETTPKRLKESVKFFKGTTENEIYFVGYDNQDTWVKAEMKDFYFLSKGAKVIWLRVSKDCNLKSIKQFLVSTWSVVFDNPVLRSGGTELNDTALIKSFSDQTVFLLQELEISENLKFHSAKLFHCSCGSGYNNIRNFKRHNKNGNHELMFGDVIPSTWGRSDNDRNQSKNSDKFCLLGVPKLHVSLREAASIPTSSSSTIRAAAGPPATQSPPASTRRPCGYCKTASHVCRKCNMKRCKQHHLNTFDDGKSFICSVCDPRVRGILNSAEGQVPMGKSNDKGEKGEVSQGTSKRPKRNVKKPNYTQEKVDDDISSMDSESDSEKNFGSDVDELVDKVPIVKKVKPKKKWFDSDRAGTDAEDEDTDEKSEIRHERMKALEDDIISVYSNPPTLFHIFKPNEEDEKLIKKYVVIPTLQVSAKVTNLGENMPSNIQNAMKEGQLPTGELAKDFKYWSNTGRIHHMRIIQLLGLVQEHIQTLNPDHYETLPHLQLVPTQSGDESVRKLCVSQFFKFKEADGLELPDVRDLIADFDLNPGKMAQMVTAYEHLCNGVIRFLQSTEGTMVFLNNKVGREREMELVEMRLVASGQKQTEITKIKNLISLTKSNKFFVRMRNKQKNLQNQTEKAKEDFGASVIPDPNVVSERWLTHPEVHAMNRMLVELAGSDVIPSATDMNASSEHLILSEAMKNGFRQQIFAVLEYGDFLTGMKKGYAAFPFTPLHQTKGVDPAKVKANLWKGPGGEVVYRRPDPYSPDPNDPHDPMVDPDERVWELMRGKLLEVEFHKTAGEPQQIWLSQYGLFYFKCYESIRAKYLHSIGEDPSDITKPFFINSRGTHYIGPQGTLDMTTFCRRVEIQWQPSHVCRKMMVRAVYNSNNAILKEYEQSALCHQSLTAEDHYLGRLSDQVKSLTVTAWYREHLDLNADMVVNTKEIEDAWMSNLQGKRCLEGMKKLTEQDLRCWLEAEERKASIIKPTYTKVVTPNVKVAIVRLIKEATLEGYPVSARGSPAELLLDGRSVRTPEHISLILRMLVLMPQDSPSVQMLRNNLLDYAGLLAEDALPPRKLMVSWATKIVEIFHTMRTRVTHIANPIVCKELSDIAMELNGSYLLGNTNVQRQLAYWIGLAKERDAAATGQMQIVSANSIYDKLEKSRKELAEKRVKLGRSKEISVDEEIPEHPSEECLEEYISTVVVGDVEVEVDNSEPINITINTTPKKPTRFLTTWDDDLKFQLLSQYVEKCSDPMVPIEPKNGRQPKITAQCEQLRNEEVIYGGSVKKWKEISTTETLSNNMFRSGFVKQGWRNKREPSRGLHAIIEKVVGGNGTTAMVKENIPEILAKAKEFMP